MRQLKITKTITNRDPASLEKYLEKLSRDDVMTYEEEIELAKRIKQGDREALEKLVRVNIRYVTDTAKQYQNQGLDLSDLINEGNLALIRAAENFDETQGRSFIRYADYWIRKSMLQAIAEQNKIVRSQIIE